MATIKKTTPSELHKLLCEGVVKFQYKKKDGSTRTANGTLKSSLITKKPVGGDNKVENAGYSVYFDIDKNAFRCYSSANLLGVIED